MIVKGLGWQFYIKYLTVFLFHNKLIVMIRLLESSLTAVWVPSITTAQKKAITF